jgi:GTP-binding protein Era
LLDEVKKHLKLDKILYPEEYYTASDVHFRISEVIREKVFLNTGDEIPHSSYVEVEEYDDTKELLRIVAYIYTETDSQRYIVI